MSCFGVEIRDIVIVILTILIAYLFYKTRKVEGFADATVSDMVRQAVNDTYLVDISAMRNLANISQDIMSNKDDLTLPTNITIPGNLKVDGNVFFTNKNTNLMNLFPKFMIIALNNSEGIPKGWAMCDGKKYKMDPLTGVVSLLNMETIDADSIITPDLRGRFILGAGVGAMDQNGVALSNRIFTNIGTTGGEEKHTLTVAETPIHSHYQYANRQWGERVPLSGVNYPAIGTQTGDNGAYNIYAAAEDNGLAVGANVGLTSWIGGGGAHENMPPFYVLIYIMKL